MTTINKKTRNIRLNREIDPRIVSAVRITRQLHRYESNEGDAGSINEESIEVDRLSDPDSLIVIIDSSEMKPRNVSNHNDAHFNLVSELAVNAAGIPSIGSVGIVSLYREQGDAYRAWIRAEGVSGRIVTSGKAKCPLVFFDTVEAQADDNCVHPGRYADNGLYGVNFRDKLFDALSSATAKIAVVMDVSYITRSLPAGCFLRQFADFFYKVPANDALTFLASSTPFSDRAGKRKEQDLFSPCRVSRSN